MDEIKLIFGEDGKASLYDDTYDITIHCESKEEQEKVEKVLQNTPRWIPCSERLPGVGQSVLMSVGGMYTAEGCLREDGNWAQFRWDAVQRKDMVGAWQPLPEPWKEEKE